ncbi:MAG TPA: glycosyltransferase family 39 protein, partial [Candidatus Ozemobacteraceae bacterium]|nr:glycosyltransferase family 39 protein [Candidatus Ozemobacteraceae bacterium]
MPGLLLVSLVLRLYRIGEESLWLDEIETVRLVQLPFGEMMNYIVHADSHPPLYSLLLHLWVRIAGTSETAVRFWSAIFGCLSVWATYLTGTVIFNRRTGLIAGLLLAIAPFHVYYSQEARMYALLGLFAAGMMLALWQVTFDQRSRWRYLLVVTSVGALFTQNIALFLIVLQNLWYLLTRHCHHMRPRQWLYLQITIVSLAFFWLPGLYLQLHATRNIGFLSWIQSPTLAHVADVLFEFCGAFPIHSESEPSIPYLGAAGILSLGFLVAFLVPFITQIRHSLNSGSSTTSDPDFSATVFDNGTSVMSVPVATRLRCHQILYLGLWFVIPIVSPLLLSYV